LFIATICHGQDSNLKVHYVFSETVTGETISDVSGNGNSAVLKKGAKIINLENIKVLYTGNGNGYLDMGERLGEVINTLDDFTISTYVYIDPSTSLTSYGNFIWTFSKVEDILVNPGGCMFLSARTTRYAISPTNWSEEFDVGKGEQGIKGEWVHYTYTQNGSQGTIYVNGTSAISSPSINMSPSDLGNTSFNFLAKSCYSQDVYLQKAFYSDFRIYDIAISPDSIASLALYKSQLDTLIFQYLVQNEIDSIRFSNIDNVKSDLVLPQAGNENVTINWNSSDESVITNTGTVIRPVFGADTATVFLTAKVSCKFITVSKTFEFKVVPSYSDKKSVDIDFDALTIEGNLHNLRSNLNLKVVGNEGSAIFWESDMADYLDNNGVIKKRPEHGEGKLKIKLTATVLKGLTSKTKSFVIYLAEDEGYSGYLFVYFTGNYDTQEAIRFALSSDGLVYKALNNNDPVLNSGDISRTGGIRDPHILRGEDGNFYMVATDMVSANGWSSNSGIVLLKSNDLINWTSSNIDIPEAYPELFGQANRVWAPESIYDSLTGKNMIYFSIHNNDGAPDKFYYAYADTSFIGFENEPKVFFSQESAVIDANIVKKGSLYHLFYKTEGEGQGLKKAISKNLTGPYTTFDKYLQPNKNPVEGECIFRFINTDTYCLIYDVYTRGYYEFTQSTNLENFTILDGVSFDFAPRHGTIIPITGKEMVRLQTQPINYIGPTPELLPDTTTNTSSIAKSGQITTICTQLVVSKDGIYFNCERAGRADIYNLQGIKLTSCKVRKGTNHIYIPNGIYVIKQTIR
jgi:hypothetical protein